MTDYSPTHQALLDTVPLPAGARIEGERMHYDESGTALDGFLVADAATDGPRPAVLVLHDWTGEQEYTRVRAEMLARLGLVAFAADLYGAGVRPTGDDAAAEAGRYYGDLPLLRRRVQAAYDVLASDPRVDPSRIVVIGYCFGGSASIEFARTGAALAGAVSFHGGLVTHDPADVESIRTPLLVLTGADDPVVPDEAVVAFEDELRQNPAIDWQIVLYSGAPHAFTLPEESSWRPVADARSWRAFRAFLDEVLA
ncbi:dienelactone hydrolase family protein [Herbiconiux sp. VKM Ac-1786]|uniref:dienelactone hydrolase family protein n=1 Tax=Herbiconiux sp. VKM Ac-1786 TaxID=2783824 RepID=UPI00188A2EAB|nr:dienelactone hydrolase family protein [Herbiconiux sp. VKM Ac-1786]MBF4573271.1 dienelactone hydrolase family protein [Herbiconiux sp. VKM Ac-1786]